MALPDTEVNVGTQELAFLRRRGARARRSGHFTPAAFLAAIAPFAEKYALFDLATQAHAPAAAEARPDEA